MDNADALPSDIQESVAARVRSGHYASASEVIRAGLQALDREEAVWDDLLRRKVETAFADPRPSIPADEVFAELRSHHEATLKAGMRDA